LAERHQALAWVRFWPGAHVSGREAMLVAYLGLAVSVATFFACAFAYIGYARSHPKSVIGKRSVTWLIVALLALLELQSHLRGFAWFACATFELMLGNYIWFIAYTLVEPKSSNATSP